MTVPCWFLLVALGIWCASRVLLSPSGQKVLDSLAARLRGTPPVAGGDE